MQIIRGLQADFLMLGEYLKQRLIHFLIKLDAHKLRLCPERIDAICWTLALILRQWPETQVNPPASCSGCRCIIHADDAAIIVQSKTFTEGAFANQMVRIQIHVMTHAKELNRTP